MDIGSVPGEIGILLEYREVTGTPRRVNGLTWATSEKREGARRGPPARRRAQEESYSSRE